MQRSVIKERFQGKPGKLFIVKFTKGLFSRIKIFFYLSKFSTEPSIYNALEEFK